MRKFGEYSAIFSIGASGYSLIEILWRGFTHWTMALTGGICFLSIYVLEAANETSPLWKKCLAGSLIITLAELVVGFIVNILLGWMVWDYSTIKFNFHGQVCLLYSALWFLLCIPANFICSSFRRIFRNHLSTRSS
jgi:uncharacterized membrane protein